MARPKREYNRTFAANGKKTGSYSMHLIPLELLNAAKRKAKAEGVSLRHMLLKRLQRYVESEAK